MPRARVLLLIPTLDQSGAEKQLALLADGLPREEFDVRVCALGRGGPCGDWLRQRGFEPILLGKRLKFDPACFRRLVRLLGDWRPDILHTWLFAANAYGRAAARWAGIRRVVAAERCVDVWKGSLERRVDRWLAPWTAAVAANSAAVAAFYRARLPLPPERVVVIPNAAAPLEPPGPSEPWPEPLEADWRRPDRPKFLACVGRLWPQKRVADVLWATDILRLSGWDIRLLVIGDGPQRDELLRFAANLELDGVAWFLGHRADAARCVARCDALVLASDFEGMPNVVLEAMAAGKPVAATRIPGMDEVVADGVTGVLCPPRQPFELARGLLRLLADPAAAAAMGAAGKARADDEFSLAKMVAAHAALYRRLLAEIP